MRGFLQEQDIAKIEFDACEESRWDASSCTVCTLEE